MGRRIQNYSTRRLDSILFRRPFIINSKVPFISFTFDDFPRSALYSGGEILMQYGLKATYYASFSLMGTSQPAGAIFHRNDIQVLLEHGHELGSHTFDHCDSFSTSARRFEESLHQNQRALTSAVPGATFRTFAYPMSGPHPLVKLRTGKYFDCCRAGGQTYNYKMIDLNLLKAYFIEKSRGNFEDLKQIINRNSEARGWLILATHDISESPSIYGCTPGFFEEIIKYSLDSGAVILPVAETLDALRLSSKF